MTASRGTQGAPGWRSDALACGITWLLDVPLALAWAMHARAACLRDADGGIGGSRAAMKTRVGLSRGPSREQGGDDGLEQGDHTPNLALFRIAVIGW
jgi:hypothetical protein